jgi:dihydrodipicolinate synthase/N-acetylneuraminate lyase
MRFVFMLEVLSLGREIRPGFQLLAGTDYMVSNGVLGGMGAFSPLSSVAPKLARQLYDMCKNQQFTQARKVQEDVALLNHTLKMAGFAGLKAAMQSMGRECGVPRLPVRSLDKSESSRLAEQIAAMPFLKAEPRGW